MNSIHLRPGSQNNGAKEFLCVISKKAVRETHMKLSSEQPQRRRIATEVRVPLRQPEKGPVKRCRGKSNLRWRSPEIRVLSPECWHITLLAVNPSFV